MTESEVLKVGGLHPRGAFGFGELRGLGRLMMVSYCRKSLSLWSLAADLKLAMQDVATRRLNSISDLSGVTLLS